jgi:hypothetical protein
VKALSFWLIKTTNYRITEVLVREESYAKNHNSEDS